MIANSAKIFETCFKINLNVYSCQKQIIGEYLKRRKQMTPKIVKGMQYLIKNWSEGTMNGWKNLARDHEP